ncbi:serine protease [Marimonas sp. MJW-29]|uniref:Serine protease n=1 Tax=Sulfitobacter sediminis TaxID=3234186 RepID=A0ABV3RGT9_9RHOB
MRLRAHIVRAALVLSLITGVAEAQSTNLRKLETENDALVWRAVGRLDIGRAGFCTGTLIAPDLVLTAAHCVYDSATRSLYEAGEMTFQAGMTNGVPAALREVAQIEAHAGYDPTTPFDEDRIRHDVALVRLAEPIPTHELDPFIVFSGRVTQGPVSVVSYGRGRAETLSRQNQCQVVGERDRIIAVDCDVTFGSSGAPVFTHLNGRGQIASIISGGTVTGGRKIAYGMALPALVADLKRQMYANKPRPTATVRRLGVGGNKSSIGAKFVTPGGS